LRGRHRYRSRPTRATVAGSGRRGCERGATCIRHQPRHPHSAVRGRDLAELLLIHGVIQPLDQHRAFRRQRARALVLCHLSVHERTQRSELPLLHDGLHHFSADALLGRGGGVATRPGARVCIRRPVAEETQRCAEANPTDEGTEGLALALLLLELPPRQCRADEGVICGRPLAPCHETLPVGPSAAVVVVATAGRPAGAAATAWLGEM
jgi:hypothetical protein